MSPALTRVLCAEDDPDIRLILGLSLEEVGGFETCLCASGEEALERFEGLRPQLVLLDVMMPGLSGPDTLTRLRERGLVHGVPVLFLTAKALRDELDALTQHGVTGIIVKPFDPMTLPDHLRLCWQHGQTSAH